MELTKKQRTIKYGVYCLLILLAQLFQNISGLWPEIAGARCLFIVPVTVILSIEEDPKIAAIIGFVSGIMWDCLTAQHMGFNFVFLTLICYILSSFISYLLRPTFWVQFAGAAIAVALYCVFYWLFFMVISKSEGSFDTLWYFYIPSMVYTIFMSFVACLVLKPVKALISKKIK